MSSISNKTRASIRSKKNRKNKSVTKSEMILKMLADQKIIREAIQKGISLKELEKTHGFKFATLPSVKDK